MIQPGIYYGKDNEFYNSIDAYRSTSIKQALKGPEYYFMDFKSTPSMELGTALHEKILEPHVFDYQQRADYKKEREIYNEQKRKGIKTLSGSEWDHLLKMEEAFFGNSKCRELYEITRKEVIAVSSYSDNHNVKAKADMLGMTFIADLKTTSELPLNHDAALKLMRKYDYHMSAAYYIDVFQSQTKDAEIDTFTWIFIESKPPYKVVLVDTMIDSDLFREGRMRYKKALEKSIRFDESLQKKEELYLYMD